LRGGSAGAQGGGITREKRHVGLSGEGHGGDKWQKFAEQTPLAGAHGGGSKQKKENGVHIGRRGDRAGLNRIDALWRLGKQRRGGSSYVLEYWARRNGTSSCPGGSRKITPVTVFPCEGTEVKVGAPRVSGPAGAPTTNCGSFCSTQRSDRAT